MLVPDERVGAGLKRHRQQPTMENMPPMKLFPGQDFNWLSTLLLTHTSKAGL
jgi:hypothetical protein